MSSFTLPSDDAARAALIRNELYTPVVGDILDALGRYHQILPATTQPMRETMKVVGRARPALMIDVHGPQKKPFGLLTAALDESFRFLLLLDLK